MRPKKMTVLPTAIQTFRALESPPPRIFGRRPPLDGIGGTPPDVRGTSEVGPACPIALPD
jgi:hypothetical protein